ncbi:hypothetical protein PN836_012700 [Ningiella sp. W23]|uniref:hypothetical protein n=1 Tax=Ningiella sp. W23 TaxID=3023715 RepID=UPI00375699CA
MKQIWIKHSFVFLMIASLASCSMVREYDLTPQPLEVNKEALANDGSVELGGSEEADDGSPRIKRDLPSPPQKNQSNTALSFDEAMELKGDSIAINVASLPLPQFINEVLGNQLGLSFYLDPRLEDKQDLVTLNINDPLPPQELYRTVQTVLQAYGVALRNDNGLIQVEFSPTGTSTEPPILISGEALPSVPSTHRPVFFLMDLNVVQAQRAVGWLAQAFEGQNAKFSSDPERNAVWLRGSLDIVKQAAEVVRLVDQPLMRGRQSMRIEPRYLGADALSARLAQMLQAQGYYAQIGRPGAVSLFTIEETNSIIVFANDEDVLAYVEEWVKDLDQPLKQTKGDSVFYYEVKNTSAQDVADAINELLGGGAAAQPQQQGQGNQAATNDAGPIQPGSATTQNRRGNLVVDLGRNAILFYGSNNEWVTMLPAIERLDQRPLQVLIEVIVADVTLSDSFRFGVDWSINNPNNSSSSNLFTEALGNVINVQGGAFTFTPLSSSGYTRAVLSTLAEDNQVKILQTPRILVKSGEEATVTVGDEIPLLSSSQSSVEGGALIQQVVYRNTGILLSVKPVIYAGGEVDLQITQETSNSTADADDPTLSPTISNRRVSTSLSIKDGGSVLVAGVISNNENSSDSKVPILGDIPFLGSLFGSQSRGSTRSELMILISTYIVSDDKDADAVTDAFKKQLTLHSDEEESN